MFIHTQRIDYPDHTDEIAFLNGLLADMPKPFPPEFKQVVEGILHRLDEMMLASQARVRPYDQNEERRA